MAKSRSTYVQLGLLSLLLIVAPLVSYLYLKKGFEYRVDSLDELGHLGFIGDALSYSKAGQGKTVDIVYMTPPAASDTVGLAILQLYDAFRRQDSVQFIGIRQGAEPLIADASQGQELASNAANIQLLRQYGDKDPHCEQVPLEQRALLVDTLGQVRRCYNLHRGAEVNRIVEQLNILLPRPAKQDIFITKQREY